MELIKNTYHVIGVMSGTSLDGIDLAQCFFEYSEGTGWKYRMGRCTTVPYSETWKRTLAEAVHFSEGRLKTLNEDYTRFLSEVIASFISNNEIEDVDAVCSHGHTVLHQPEHSLTLQIGNLKTIAERTGQLVVCDFRVQDVAMGGQGAPLVPIGDRLLFPEFDYCLNLGGFANVSSEQNKRRIAYDICPVNVVLNQLAERLGAAFDRGGELARSGEVQNALLADLNALDYYSQTPPKSLGVEWVQKYIKPIIKKNPDLSSRDLLRTFTEHVAHQISTQFELGSKVLVTGGGAYNDFLLECIRSIKPVQLERPQAQLIEYKEALVFGLLGVLKLRDEPNCLASVTGAPKDHSSGTVYRP